MRGRGVRGRDVRGDITQNNNGNSQVRRSSDWCRKSLILIPLRKLIWFAITSLGEERANLSAFRTFVRFVLV